MFYFKLWDFKGNTLLIFLISLISFFKDVMFGAEVTEAFTSGFIKSIVFFSVIYLLCSIASLIMVYFSNKSLENNSVRMGFSCENNSEMGIASNKLKIKKNIFSVAFLVNQVLIIVKILPLNIDYMAMFSTYLLLTFMSIGIIKLVICLRGLKKRMQGCCILSRIIGSGCSEGCGCSIQTEYNFFHIVGLSFITLIVETLIVMLMMNMIQHDGSGFLLAIQNILVD